MKNTELGADVLKTLRSEGRLELHKGVDSNWLITGIRLSDSYFAPVRLSAGTRDWQRDFATVASPILIGASRCLAQSADAQAVIIPLCNVIAQRLRLSILWPEDANEVNDIKNAIYSDCRKARELESDNTLISLRQLRVVGPE